MTWEKIHRYYCYSQVLVSTISLQTGKNFNSCSRHVLILLFSYLSVCVQNTFKKVIKNLNLATKLRCRFLFLNFCRKLSDKLLTYRKGNKTTSEGNPL